MEEFNNNIEKFLPFLEDLRRRLYRGVILFATLFLGGFFLAGSILERVLGIVRQDQVTIAVSSPFQFIDVAMDVGFFVAIVACAPYMIYSFYIFIVPALTRQEKMQLLRSVPLSIALFIGGFFYGFFILNYALGLLASINTSLGVANFWNISQFLSEIFITSALLGFVFEFPLLLTLLIKLGIVTAQTLRDKRRIAYFMMLALTALLPPTDGVSLIAMALPLVLLYELTIVFNRNQHAWIRP